MEVNVNTIERISKEIAEASEGHIEEYVRRMLEVAEKIPELAHKSKDLLRDIYRPTAYHTKPVVEVLSVDESIGEFRFQIISPPMATLWGGCIGNDTNIDRHTGPQAITQSNALIGICTDAVMRALGGSLLIVDPLNFRKALPLEHPVIVTIVILARGKLTKGTIEVVTETGEIIMRKAKLTMSSS